MRYFNDIKWNKTVLPQNLQDLIACLFLCACIPTVYWLEIFIVVPALFPKSLVIFHVLLGTFVVINIISNFFAIMIVDTSTKQHLLPSQLPKGWHVCAECEAVAPPKSRHCHSCKTCILRREHHCIFTGCCIGLRNHRYFYIFLGYIWLSTFYISGLNIFFIWPYVGGFNAWTPVRLIIPGIWLVWNPSVETLYTFLFSLSFIGFLFVSVLMQYYTSLLFNNATTYEKTIGSKKLNSNTGNWDNFKIVLGSKWYLTWVFPAVHSQLPYDGFNWNTKTEQVVYRHKVN